MLKNVDLDLIELEIALEEKVIAAIRRRQEKIPGLKTKNRCYTAYLGDKLNHGCRACLSGNWTQIRTTTQCELNCLFCYYHNADGDPARSEIIPVNRYLIYNRLFSLEDLKLLFDTQGEMIQGVAWLNFEPLMEPEKLFEPIKYLNKKGCYQWMYTNGLKADEDLIMRLADAGLDELRFNLAATDCSDKVIKNMENARRYLKHLCIESPVLQGFYESFMEKRKRILDIGIDQINLAELQIMPATLSNCKSEGPLYCYRQGYVSPIRSRQLTYDIFETAVKEKWKPVIHDCSNENKFFRGMKNSKSRIFGKVNYRNALLPDMNFYLDALLYLADYSTKVQQRIESWRTGNKAEFIDPKSIYKLYMSLKDDLPGRPESDQ